MPAAIEYRHLKARNPEYDPKYWRDLVALYAGGETLLRNEETMKRLFPRHAQERGEIYRERAARAFYVNYAGSIIDHLVAGLFTDPVRVEVEPEGRESEFYESFYKDCSPPRGRKLSWNNLLRKQILTALQCRRAWTLIDLPDMGPEFQAANVAEQREAGALDAYAVPLEPDQVVNWEFAESGELLWVLTLDETRRQLELGGDREMVTETYYYYTSTDWTRYVVKYSLKDDDMLRPTDTDVIAPESGPHAHTFGRVPIVLLDLDPRLWAMNRLESLARENFNKGSAESWAEYKALYAQLYEFLAPELAGVDGVVNEHQEDPARGVNQPHGIGYAQIRGNLDKAEYIGPDTSAFAIAQKSLDRSKDEMHRVLYQMALATDNTAAALGRSADSKALDRSMVTVLLLALGAVIREHTEESYEMVAHGRGDEDLEFEVSGAEKFDPATVQSLVEQAMELEGVSIPSPTFQRRFKFSVARRVLGDEVSEDDLSQIRDELETNITGEQFEMGATGALMPGENAEERTVREAQERAEKGAEK